MKHTVELKLPKIWGRKKKTEDTEITTEIDLDNTTSVPAVLIIGAPLVIGVTVGYLVGFKHGVGKGGTSIVVVK